MINSNIRIPEDLWEQLRKISEEEERSINSQLIFIIRRFLEERSQEQLTKTVEQLKKKEN